MVAQNPNISRLLSTSGQDKQRTGTGFTNLQRLTDANKGNQLGQKVAGNVGQQVGGIQSRLSSQYSDFQKEAEKNAVGNETDKDSRNVIMGRFLSPSSPGQELTDDEVKSFGRYTKGEYSGPTSLQDTGTLKSQAEQLKGQVGNLSPSGTQELLRRSVGGDRYTQGQQRLDSLLMGQSHDSQDSMRGVQRQVGTLGSEINRTNLAASGKAEQLKGQSKQFAEQTKGLLNTGLTEIDKTVEGQLKAAQAVEIARQDKLKQLQGITDTGLTGLSTLQKTLKDVGIDESQVNQLLGTTDVQETNNRLEALKRKAFDDYTQNGSRRWQQLVGAGFEGEPHYVANRYYEGDVYNALVNKDYSLRGDGIVDGSNEDLIKPSQEQLSSFKNESVLSKLLGNLSLNGGYSTPIYTGAIKSGDASPLQSQIMNSILANSDQAGAADPTKQSIASDAQIANYNNLAKLMGTQDNSIYQARTPEVDSLGRPVLDAQGNQVMKNASYTPGKIGLDVEQIKRALGY